MMDIVGEAGELVDVLPDTFVTGAGLSTQLGMRTKAWYEVRASQPQASTL